MKQSLIVFIVLLALLSGCRSNSAIAEIEGEIKGLKNDTIYIYGNDEFAYFIEPITVKEGKFSLNIPLDTTLVQTILYINEDEQYPIYLERGKTVGVKGNIDQPGRYEVKGNSTNEELTQFIQTLPPSTNPPDTLTLRLAEEYILNHQRSLINIYLLSKYFVEIPHPHYAKIKELIKSMHGTLQDKPYIVGLIDFIEQAEKVEVDKIAPSFVLKNTEGKNISRSDFRDKYLLINFWASWSDSYQAANKELKALYKVFPPAKEDKNKIRKTNVPKNPELAILSISLDMDKVAWKDAIEQDTMKWEQASDFLGWSSPLVQQYGINKIPYNVLIDNKGRIIARGIEGEDLRQKLDSLLIPQK